LGVLQAPQFHRPPFDFLTFEQDGLAAARIDICRSEIVQALVIALVVVVADEWALARRYMSLESLARIVDNPVLSLPGVGG
jgi:hypothetical protein